MKTTSLRRAAMLAAILGVLAAVPASADAVTATQLVSGQTAGVLSLSGGAATSAGVTLTPGSTTTTTGLLTLGVTLSNWTLTVQDTASGTPGHMRAATTGCTGSEPSLTSPLTASISTGLGVTPSAPVTISGTAQEIAAGTALGALALTTNYSQPVGASEALLSGCVYSLTATYTLTGS